MNLSRFNRRPIVTHIAVLLAAPCLIAATLTVEASSNHAKPGQKSTTCYINMGPKLGENLSLKGKFEPMPLGKACNDGEGNSGFAVLDKEDEEAEEAEEAAKLQSQIQKIPAASAP